MFRQAFLGMLQEHDKTMRERCNVARASRTRQTNYPMRTVDLSRIQIAEAIHFGSAQEAEMYTPRLQQAHHAHHVEALRRTPDVWRIGHGVDQLGSRRSADDTICEQSNCIRRMSAFSNYKGDQRQAHADENIFAILDLAGCGRDHELTKRVGERLRNGWS